MATAYPPELRDKVIAHAHDHGVTEAAKTFGVGKATVSRWCSNAGVGTVPSEQTKAATDAARTKREATREALKGLLLDKARDMLDRMDEIHIDYRGKDCTKVEFDKAPAGACQNYATSAAILIDKSQLLDGAATSRTETAVTGTAGVVLDELAARRARAVA